MATRSLGTLTIDLVARTFGFEQGMDKAAKSLDSKVKDLKKSAVQFGAIAATAIAGASTALAVMVKQSIDAMDGMGKLAQSTGVAVEELSALAYAADLSGVSEQSLSASLVKLSRNMSDAAQGTGEAKKAFDALGISVTNADGGLKSAGDVLAEVAGKFSQYRDGAEKSALAVALFGRSGADLIPLLNSGAEGLAQMTDEANELGLTLNEDAGNAAAAFNDNLTRLSAVKKGLVNRITIELLPSLVNLTDRLVGSAKSAERLDQVARIASTGMKLLTSAGIIVGGVFKTLGEAIGGVAAAVVQLVSGNFREAFNIAGDMQVEFLNNITGTISAVQAVWDDTANEIAAKAPETGDKVAAPMINAEEKVRKSGKRIVDEAKRVYERVEDAIARIRRDIDTFGMTNEQIELYDLAKMGAVEDQLERANKLLQDRKALIDQQRGQDVLDALNAEIDGLGKSAEWLAKREALLRAGTTAETEMGQAILKTVEDLYRQGEAIDLQIGLMDTFRMEASDAIADVVSGTKSLKDGFLDMLDAINQRVVQMIAEGWIERLFGQMGTTNTGSGGGWLASLAGILFGGGGRAGGGMAQPYRAVQVNEAGIEMATVRGRDYLLTGDAPVQVTPANRVGTGGTQINNFVVQGRIDRRTQDQIAASVGRQSQRAIVRNG